MSEAVIRVARSVGDAVNRIRDLSREAAEAQRNVAGLDSDMANFQQRQAEAARQQQAQPTARRPLTESERAQLSGRYSESDLRNAVWSRPPTESHPGTLLIRPVRPEGQSDDHGQLIPGSMYSRGGLSTERSRRAAIAPEQPDTANIDEETRATASQEQAVTRLTKAKQRDGITDREFRRDHRENQRDLREQDRDIDRLTTRIDRLRTAKASVHRDDEMTQSRARLEDLRMGRHAMIEERDDIAAEARRRGMRDDAGILTGGGRGGSASGGRSYLSTFLGAAGIGGGGGVGGLIAGGITGAMSLPMLGVAGAGLLVGAGISRGTRGYARYVEQTGSMLPMALAGGINADRLLESTRGMSDRHRMFDAPSIRAAMASLGRSTGHIGAESVLDVAALTGQSPSEEAARVGAMARYAPHHDPFMSTRILLAYKRSSMGRNLRLFSQFAQHVQSLQQRSSTPTTRIDPEAIAGEMSTATRELHFPGIDMNSAGGMDVTSNAVGATNNLVGREQGGLMGELQLMAIARLRQDHRLVERLKKYHDIDINTVPGMLRAIEAAPRLATMPTSEGGTSQVAEALFNAPIKALPPWIAEMELGDKFKDRNLAHRMVSDPGAFLSVLRAGGSREEVTSDTHQKAMKLAEGDDVKRWWEMYSRPQNELEGVGQGMSPIGDVLQKEMNDMKKSVDDGMKGLVSAVSEILTRFFDTDLKTGDGIPGASRWGAGGYDGTGAAPWTLR